jgi:hypothetical protein
MAQIKVLLVEGNEGDTRRTPVDDVLQLLSPQTIQKTSNLSEWCPPEFRMDFTVCNPE